MKAEDINVSYEEALKLAPLDLRNKIQHSVELIRKAEKLALIYDAKNGFYNTFSGGKDSQALYYIVKMSGVKFQTHMNLTSVDPADVIRFVKTQYPSVIRHKPQISIYKKAIEMGLLPTITKRWCCREYKEIGGAGKVKLIGIRSEESVKRSKKNEVGVSANKFSGNIEEFKEWRNKQIERKKKRILKNQDEFLIKNDNEVRCINGKDSILISPIFDWTQKEVWYFLNNIIKAPHCKLYDEGQERIGCIMCPMKSLKRTQKDIEKFPYVKKKWIDTIKLIRKNKKFYKYEFTDNPNATEDEIAENIFDYWISRESYNKWYADKFLQQKIKWEE